MRAIQKLKSQQGASLIFSLILFLVCAVISSVVIVAGSVASGRLSNLAENDQRYYAVTSAAKLLRDVVEQHTVEITQTTSEVITYVVKDGKVVPSSSSDAKPEGKPIIKINDVKLDSDAEDYPILVEAAQYLLEKQETKPFPVWSSDEMEMNVKADALLETLNTTVKVTLADAYGKLYVTVFNKTDTDLMNRFMMTMTFSLDHSTTTGTQMKEVESWHMVDDHYECKRKKETKNKDSFCWKMTEIRNGAQVASVA